MNADKILELSKNIVLGLLYYTGARMVLSPIMNMLLPESNSGFGNEWALYGGFFIVQIILFFILSKLINARKNDPRSLIGKWRGNITKNETTSKLI